MFYTASPRFASAAFQIDSRSVSRRASVSRRPFSVFTVNSQAGITILEFLQSGLFWRQLSAIPLPFPMATSLHRKVALCWIFPGMAFLPPPKFGAERDALIKGNDAYQRGRSLNAASAMAAKSQNLGLERISAPNAGLDLGSLETRATIAPHGLADRGNHPRRAPGMAAHGDDYQALTRDQPLF